VYLLLSYDKLNVLILKLPIQEYSVEIYEWSGTSWKPYVADDVQLQFFMMSPYVLKTMSTDNKVRTY
jgi:hypothetical protein